ncbi:MAG: HupE/UreJ family protein [Elainellaceae cyanobacterium]
MLALPAYAHHPTGSKLSSTFIEGLLSGLGHPIIGIDHLAFIITVGLLAVTVINGLWMPIAFVLSALVGTGIHLVSFDLPAPELFISASVLLFGGILAMNNQPKIGLVIPLAAIAGLFHGYAYGEAIVGATPVPLFAYLLGFTLMQIGIALSAYKIGSIAIQQAESSSQSLRFAGFTALGIGIAFLSAQLLG